MRQVSVPDMGWFDVHAHLTDPRLARIEDEVIARAADAGVTTIISNGLNPADNQRVLDLSRRHDIVQPAFGLYPVDAVLLDMLAMGEEYPRDDEPVSATEALQWVVAHVEECVAIGEVGLDRYWVPEALWEKQENIFRQFVQLAMDCDKPLIIHTRKAERRAFEILVEMQAPRVNWHCYSSKVKFGKQIAAHGHYLSIPANARKAENFTRLIEVLPKDKILLETDCPYLAPERGALNEPSNVALTATYMAELWDASLEDVENQVCSNFETLFGFTP